MGSISRTSKCAAASTRTQCSIQALLRSHAPYILGDQVVQGLQHFHAQSQVCPVAPASPNLSSQARCRALLRPAFSPRPPANPLSALTTRTAAAGTVCCTPWAARSHYFSVKSQSHQTADVFASVLNAHRIIGSYVATSRSRYSVEKLDNLPSVVEPMETGKLAGCPVLDCA